MRRAPVSALALALLAAWLGSCGEKGFEPELTGCATDEHWAIFDSAAAQVKVDPQAPVFTAPTSGATLPGAPKPIFRWQRTPSEVGAPDGDVSHPAGGPFPASPDCVSCCENFNVGALTTLHLPPISGTAYDLQFSIDGKRVHRVITTLQAWTPTDQLWEGWKGKTVSVRITRGALLRNDLREGLVRPEAPLTFTVGG